MCTVCCVLLEYCCVVWHSTLTKEQSTDIERVQKTSLKIILAEEYSGYTNALKMCNLQTLSSRREKRCLNYGLKAIKHTKHEKLFPLNTESNHDLRNIEKFHVNYARTSAYKMSTVPYVQRLLNNHFSDK